MMNQAQRVLEILKKLADKKEVCTKSLYIEFGVENIRTIQRDINLLKEFLKDSLISNQRGCYQLLDTKLFSNILQNSKDNDDMREFFEFLSIFDIKTFKFLESDEFSFFKKLKKESSQIYSIFESPIEDLKNTRFLNEIKNAIRYRNYCDITYNEKDKILLKNLKPQKILYAKNNWYLAVVSKDDFQENAGFKRLRINFIEDFHTKKETFHTDIQAQEHIKNMQSLFEDFNTTRYEVKISVASEVARYFKNKKFLSSQKLIKTEKNGDLLLSFEINNDMEIIPLIKTWLPHLKVISPLRIDQKIKDDLARY